MVCALLYLAYPKDYILAIKSIYIVSQTFYHVLLCDSCCDQLSNVTDMWQCDYHTKL